MRADGSVCFCDYGLAKPLAAVEKLLSSGRRPQFGKKLYAAPELLHLSSWLTRCGGEAAASTALEARKCDVYSLGVVFFVALFGCPPYSDPTRRDRRYAYVLSGQVQRLVDAWGLPRYPGATALVQSMLRPLPSQRVALADVQTHFWLRAVTRRTAATTIQAVLRRRAAQRVVERARRQARPPARKQTPQQVPQGVATLQAVVRGRQLRQLHAAKAVYAKPLRAAARALSVQSAAASAVASAADGVVEATVRVGVRVETQRLQVESTAQLRALSTWLMLQRQRDRAHKALCDSQRLAPNASATIQSEGASRTAPPPPTSPPYDRRSNAASPMVYYPHALLKHAKHGADALKEALSAYRLDINAIVNDSDNAAQTLLHFCAVKGEHAAARMLLTLGAAVDPKDREGRTPLHMHLLTRHCSCKLLSLLLKAGADANAEDGNGWRPLHVVASAPAANVVPAHDAAARKREIKLLQQHGADVDALTSGGDGARQARGGMSGTSLVD